MMHYLSTIYRSMATMLLLLGSCGCFTTTAISLAPQQSESSESIAMKNNEMILMDSIQINPGDTYIGQHQGSKYSDPYYLKQLGYTARSTSMEQNPALCMTYKNADRVKKISASSPNNTNYGIFQNRRNSTAWVTSYCRGIHRMMEETIEARLEIFFFTDMIVFPIALMELYPEVMYTNNITKQVSIRYNNCTEYLLQILLEEWLETFPQTSGIVVRTGETYTFDTPYHAGSTPIALISDVSEQNHIWVRYINLLRRILCLRYQTKVIFRTWFSVNEVTSYINITEQVRPHRLLYFSIKHTSGDFFRQMSPNALLQIGQHAQIVEIQIQREYEGKGSYPLYLFEHIVLGDISSGSNQSLSQLFPNGCNITTTTSNVMKGLWTWSRGGGWWGPYIHGAEFWIDFNIQMFVSWWNHDHCTTTIDTVNDLFQRVCTDIIRQSQVDFGRPYYQYSTLPHDRNYSVTSSLKDACTDLRGVMRLADKALLYGRYCLEVKGAYSNCWMWTRDDRIGGLNQIQGHLNYLRNNMTRITESLWYKQQSLMLWKEAMEIYETNVSSIFAMINPRVDRQIRNSFLYAQSYFCILESAWRSLIYGILTFDSNDSNHTLLQDAISDYDVCWNIFRAVGLTTPEFPSLYKGIYWNFPYENENEGIDATINRLREVVMLTNEKRSASIQ